LNLEVVVLKSCWYYPYERTDLGDTQRKDDDKQTARDSRNRFDVLKE